MYNTSERIKRLKEGRDHVARTENVQLVDEAYREAIEEYKDRHISIQFAHGLEKALQRRKIVILDDDILAGFLFRYTVNVNLPMSTSPDFDPAGRAPVSMDVRREVREVLEDGYATADEAAELDEFAFGAQTGLLTHFHSGHVLPNYRKLLAKGWAGLREEVRESRKSASSEDERDVLESFDIVISACSMYLMRYHEEAVRLKNAAEEQGNASRAKELSRMAEALENISTGPAASFYEAIQLVWLTHEIMYCENSPFAVSLGRVDQYLYPYYRNDIDKGIITEDEVSELIDALWVKISGYRKAYQNLAIGGCSRDGKNACNELTLKCLDTATRLKVDQPSIAFRWPEDIDDKTWKAVLRLIREGMGFPAMMYDPAYMDAQVSAGVSREDVWDYAFVGCVEPVVSGMENGDTELFRLNIPRILKLLLNRGMDVETGRAYRMKNLIDPESIGSFEELEELFFDELEYWYEKMLRCLTHMTRLYAERYPLPCISVLTEDCIVRRKGINAGGARYDHSGFNPCGVANAADGLSAVKTIVFDDKIATLTEYIEAVNNNFDGKEELREYALRKAEKYGNDCELPDRLAARIAELAADVAGRYRTYAGGTFRLGMYSVEDHSDLGAGTGATPDGRMPGVSLCNSSGASQGMDKNGPTAMINSVTRFPMRKASNGQVLDIKFTPSTIAGETGAAALRALIDTYYRKGGMEIQVSAVSRKTLLDAQAHPELYGDLVVRVSGFSAYFTGLGVTTQNEIIERTEN